ncbi:MAG: Hpt domain-containing protein [Proteobacteria bacterium]|nr:Hpt domain-containing protein [Pseudomonadota bacterium]
MYETMNKPMAGKRVNQKGSVDSIRLHLTEQFHLPVEQIDLMLPSFIATLGTHMCNLENALDANNPVQLGKLGHTIKGAFLNLGMQDCAQIALTIEEKGRQGGSLTDFKKLVEDLRLLIRPVLE